MMKYPNHIKMGDTIGITAPSDGANLKYLDDAILNLEKLGFKIVETSNVRCTEFLVSSSSEKRAEEFMSLYKDDNVDHIISARGGEFLFDMIPYLHEKYENDIREIKNIKYIQGYSDISVLLFYITTNYNIATLHSQNISAFSMPTFEKSLIDNIDLLKGSNLKENKIVQESYERYQSGYKDLYPYHYELDEKVEYKSLNGEDKLEFSGRIIGGCIDVITQLLGTKYDNTINFCNQFDEGMLWYFDICELSVCEIYRRLFQIREAGWLNNVNGILIGRTVASKDIIQDFSYKQALHKALDNLKVPVIYDVDIGHLPPQFNIINGSYATFRYNKSKGTLIQELV